MASSQLQKLENKVHIQASSEQLYDVFCNKTHHIPNIYPEKIQSVEILEGEWGKEGSIISWKFLFGGKTWVAKEVIEDINKEENKITFKVIGGDLLEHYKSFKYIIQVSPVEKGGVASLVLQYEKQNDHIPDPHTMLEFASEVIKKVGDHLTKNQN